MFRCILHQACRQLDELTDLLQSERDAAAQARAAAAAEAAAAEGTERSLRDEVLRLQQLLLSDTASARDAERNAEARSAEARNAEHAELLECRTKLRAADETLRRERERCGALEQRCASVGSTVEGQERPLLYCILSTVLR